MIEFAEWLRAEGIRVCYYSNYWAASINTETRQYWALFGSVIDNYYIMRGTVGPRYTL